MCTEECHPKQDALAAEKPVARVETRPRCSLDSRGTRIVLALSAFAFAAIAARNSASDALLLMAGPLVTVAALAIAFRYNNRAATRTSESFLVAPDTVRITRRSGKGALATIEFSPDEHIRSANALDIALADTRFSRPPDATAPPPAER
ncbi:MAG: DUF2244 domain-containing protein [Hyphomicrobiaceae bacterium]